VNINDYDSGKASQEQEVAKYLTNS